MTEIILNCAVLFIVASSYSIESIASIWNNVPCFVLNGFNFALGATAGNIMLGRMFIFVEESQSNARAYLQIFSMRIGVEGAFPPLSTASIARITRNPKSKADWNEMEQERRNCCWWMLYSGEWSERFETFGKGFLHGVGLLNAPPSEFRKLQERKVLAAATTVVAAPTCVVAASALHMEQPQPQQRLVSFWQMIRRVKKASNNDATGDSYESKSSLVGPTKSTANQNLALWLAKITTWFVFWFLLAILVTYLIDGPVIFKTVREASRSDATTATLWYIIGIHLIVLHSILMVMIFRWRRLNDFVGLRHELIAMQAVISVFWLVDAGIMLGLPSIYTRVAIFADLAAMGFHTIVIFTIPLFRVLQHRKRERRHAMLIMPETQIHDFNMDASTTTKSTTTFQSLPARQSAKPLEPSPETVGPLFQTNMAKNRPGGRGSIVPVKTEEDLERLWSSTASGKSKIINIARKYFALENCLLLSDIDDIILSATWEAHPVASNHDVDDQGEGGNTESQSAAVRLATMIHLFTKYIAPDSPYEVNIPKTLKDDFRDCINDQKKPSLPVIYEIRKHIFTLLYTNFKHLFNEVVEPKEAVEMRRQTMSNHPTPQSLRHSRSPPVIAHSKMSTTFYNC